MGGRRVGAELVEERADGTNYVDVSPFPGAAYIIAFAFAALR